MRAWCISGALDASEGWIKWDGMLKGRHMIAVFYMYMFKGLSPDSREDLEQNFGGGLEYHHGIRYPGVFEILG
jgi:hypothetical protein